MNAQVILYLAAAMALLVGAIIDDARFSVVRRIALGLAFIVPGSIVPAQPVRMF